MSFLRTSIGHRAFRAKQIYYETLELSFIVALENPDNHMVSLRATRRWWLAQLSPGARQHCGYWCRGLCPLMVFQLSAFLKGVKRLVAIRFQAGSP